MTLSPSPSPPSPLPSSPTPDTLALLREEPDYTDAHANPPNPQLPQPSSQHPWEEHGPSEHLGSRNMSKPLFIGHLGHWTCLSSIRILLPPSNPLAHYLLHPLPILPRLLMWIVSLNVFYTRDQTLPISSTFPIYSSPTRIRMICIYMTIYMQCVGMLWGKQYIVFR